MAISSPLTPKTSERNIKNLQGIILNKTKVSRETFRNKTILQDRRIENDRRALQEDVLEAPDTVRRPGGAAQLIAGSAKGFFERLMGFLGYLTAGWILSNLPTWIGMGKEFIARTVKMGNLIGGFLFNTTTIFNNITSLLGATLTNIIAFDFLDTSGRVGTAFEELQLSVDNWGTGFEDALKLITTPLTEGVASGEDAPPLGTQYTDEGAYETPPSSSSGSTTTYSSTGGQKLTDPGGKDYGDYTPGARGSRGSARVHGADGQKRGHTGEDYAMPTGTALTMIAPGTVVAAVKGDRYNAGYGEFVVVQLDDGRYVKLAHLDSINVKKGDKVGAGTGPNGTAKVIGRSGSTGLGSGPHLHLDVAKSYDSNSYMVSGTMDPKSFIDGGGLVKGGKVTATGVVTQTKPPASQPQQNLMGTSSSSSSGGGDVGPWRPLLNLIASKESAGGGYEALNPGTTFPGATKMTISEVAKEAERRRGRGTGAVGKYQQLPWFLVGRAKKAGLNPDKDLFSPANQDLIAAKVNIGMERGGNSWLSGKMKTEDFMQGLSQEFAPVPNAYGKFYYRGQSSDMTPQQVKAALEQVKKGGGSQISSPARQQSPTPAPAQITPTGTPQNPQMSQSLAPERTGPTVIVSQNPSSPARQMMSSGGGGSSGGGSSQISDFALLNNFIKNKLLLDLAYL